MSGNGVNDNPEPIDASGSVNFPSPITNSYGTIKRVNNSKSQFELPANGIFEVSFQVPVQNTGELVVVLNGVEQLMTVVGKPGSGQLVGISIITTSPGNNSILSINNPHTGENGGLKIDKSTGALSQPLSCHLIIKQLGTVDTDNNEDQ
jgi:hypothetical protein